MDTEDISVLCHEILHFVFDITFSRGMLTTVHDETACYFFEYCFRECMDAVKIAKAMDRKRKANKKKEK